VGRDGFGHAGSGPAGFEVRGATGATTPSAVRSAANAFEQRDLTVPTGMLRSAATCAIGWSAK
jgi:hypothetical protein